jgi:NADH dehydrogenase
MSDTGLHIVTGAFGYSGKYIAQRLLHAGHVVRTLTNSTERENPFGSLLDAHPYNFENPAALVASMRGARVLYNTYWVRFDHTDFTHSQAVKNTLTLFQAAKEASVNRIVHVSITNPSIDSPLPYFRGKAELETALSSSGISYAILRPTVLFGQEDVLINNIAWMLRRFPLFGVFGDGKYKIQPIYVDDLADLAIQYGNRDDNVIVNAIGPETYTYRELVRSVASAIGCRRPIILIPPRLGLLIAKLVGLLVKDVLITPEEISGLMENRLFTDSPPAGRTKLTAWIKNHAADLGRLYSSELARRRDREQSYESLRTVRN